MATSHPAKLCFVTVGATASFHQLLHAVLDQSFLVALHQFGYTHLLVQYGKDGRSLFEESLRQHLPGSTSHHGLEIDGFDFNAEGLDEEMRLAQLNPAENRSSGLIISHAGSGSILGALRLGVPLVVVPNPTLKDNHQEELARELQTQGYVVASSFQDVSTAVERAEALRSRILSWPPVSGAGKEQHQTLEQVMSDEMGFLD
ncbi:N-acetylglucosaminyldiphosphodolichol N-acetylglucosaminyltransferase catalytic subunit ALG13 [Aspergillus tanneri]|uniref:UDP-N-acetylglucosamine transferase subunit ALG13 n=1 Tax=Aspergillus tanneri TaxID=1220188 RepID=A0A5M9N5K3_9EURO|nr:N-acetylglucosaminyldiphosphodolichol N-acetylglucosaminyltransferase catalytic subunit alg13 [Aspergillus tanneri]KAA8649847.1 N-acetylglucosaminyldiphosphodolichol N-acetylglucosaminyltransferase catalytic subunit alg13 [Aspergillus tanneri]